MSTKKNQTLMKGKVENSQSSKQIVRYVEYVCFFKIIFKLIYVTLLF